MDSSFNHQQLHQVDAMASVSSFGGLSSCLLDKETKYHKALIATEARQTLPSTEGVETLPCPQVDVKVQPYLAMAEGRTKQVLQQAMDATQSKLLGALHQAAMDVIDHLGKDAAKRVCLAERKATLLEQELSAVKQQALSMIFRIKADIDAKIAELNKKILSEQRRALSADAKLAAAQETLIRLNAELTEKDEILDKMQKVVRPVSRFDVDKGREPADIMYLRQGQSMRQPSLKDVDSSRFTKKGNTTKKCKKNRIYMQSSHSSFLKPFEFGDLNATDDTQHCCTMERESQDNKPSGVGSHEEEPQKLEVLDVKKPDLQTSPVFAVWQDSYPSRVSNSDAPEKGPSNDVVTSLYDIEGQVPESLATCVVNHCSPTSTLTEGRDSRETCEASSCEFHKESRVDVLKNRKQPEDSIVHLEHFDGLYLLGDMIDGKEFMGTVKSSNELEMPDFDAVASLAELAMNGEILKDHMVEASVCRANRDESKLKSHLSGPRMKRKRSFPEKKDGSFLQQESTHTVKLNKEFERQSDTIIKHYTRRPRFIRSKASDNCITMESSRDSRRVMLGARQLLCLSERKW